MGSKAILIFFKGIKFLITLAKQSGAVYGGRKVFILIKT